jgi:hypothetical protein
MILVTNPYPSSRDVGNLLNSRVIAKWLAKFYLKKGNQFSLFYISHAANQLVALAQRGNRRRLTSLS